ncbi:hypothetical protein NC651_032488 [Populus alba x Populus x berolinensis]|nr:hypothetical protein NC651_032488 [Populus alba x Populus x berolinensis]
MIQKGEAARVTTWKTNFSGLAECWTVEEMTTEAARTLSVRRTTWWKDGSVRRETYSGGDDFIMPWNTRLKLYVRKGSLVIDDVFAPSLLENIVKPNEETVIITAQNRSEVH